LKLTALVTKLTKVEHEGITFPQHSQRTGRVSCPNIRLKPT